MNEIEHTPTYRVIDCRWSLDDPEAGRRAYRDGHIPGAVFVDVERDLAAPPGAGGRHPLPDAERFAEAMGRAGITSDTFVIAYGSLGGAERLWWLLRHFGHDACAVIGLESWRGTLVTGDGPPGAPARFVARPRSDTTISADTLGSHRHNLVIVDARIPARFHGDENPIDVRPGRIPGALNAPWNTPLPELPPGDLVAYCGSGITACVVLHHLHLAGRHGLLYPGSWSEWEQRDDLPRVRG